MKKIIAILLCVCFIFSLSGAAFASNTVKTGKDNIYLSSAVEEKVTHYPFVLVHGMMGWGENAEGVHNSTYWGMMSEETIADMLREKDYEVAVPTVSPLGSAWDRACELFAQLTGTVVDYGEAHSKACHHERYGRDYSGRALLGENGWDLETPINLVSHSFGGPTVSVFASLMEYGSREEIEASPENCSELFKGGHPGLVHSVTTLESPHNGTPAANLLYDTKLPVLFTAIIMNISGTGKKVITDFMFDQYGITKDPATGEKARFSLAKCINIAKSKDNCAYDMTLRGARLLNSKFPEAGNTYYFSVAANMTETGKFGITLPYADKINVLVPTASLVSLMSNLIIDGEYLGGEWAPNDGLVPVASALYPFGSEHTDYTEGMAVEKGVWNVLPVVTGNHGYAISGSAEKLHSIWDALTYRIDHINTAQ